MIFRTLKRARPVLTRAWPFIDFFVGEIISRADIIAQIDWSVNLNLKIDIRFTPEFFLSTISFDKFAGGNTIPAIRGAYATANRRLHS
jgi:hypothetical protein